MKERILTLALLAAFTGSYAQQSPTSQQAQRQDHHQANSQNTTEDLPIIRCFSTETQERRQLESADIPTEQQFENWMSEKIAAQPDQAKSYTPVSTLPVIFHIIHNGEPIGTGLNVSAEAVYAQIDQINRDFRRMIGSAGYNDHPDGADLRIEFCPAQVDPNGNALAEPGIDRVDGSTRSWSNYAYSASYFDYFVKPSTIWEPEDYLNIWVSPTTTGFFKVLGYAQFPTLSGLEGLEGQPDDADTDGVVVDPYTLGSEDLPNPDAEGNTGMGRTLTHELGHFFGLRHIWGDGDCSADDYCSDTPSASAPNEGCPSGIVSCGSADMIENYMDYTDDPCKNLFTEDQKSRVMAVMANSPRRMSLAMSTVCNPSAVCAPPYEAPQNTNVTFDAEGAWLSWDAQENTKGCQVRIGLASGSATNSFVQMGSGVGSLLIEHALMNPQTSYRWKVRCGCKRNPVVAGPWSEWHTFTTPGGSFMMPYPSSNNSSFTAYEIQVAPNPASDYVRISSPTRQTDVAGTVEVYDTVGRLVMSDTWPAGHEGDFVLDLPANLTGVYVIRVVAGPFVAKRKIVVR